MTLDISTIKKAKEIGFDTAILGYEKPGMPKYIKDMCSNNLSEEELDNIKYDVKLACEYFKRDR